MAVEEGQEQRPDMGSIHIGIRHDDDAMIAEFLDIVVFFADARAQCRDENPDLFVGQHLIETSLLDIEDLSLNRQDRLDRAIPALFGRPARRIPLDDEDFTQGRVPFLAIGQFSGERVSFQSAFPTAQLPCLPGRFPCSCRVETLEIIFLATVGFSSK